MKRPRPARVAGDRRAGEFSRFTLARSDEEQVKRLVDRCAFAGMHEEAGEDFEQVMGEMESGRAGISEDNPTSDFLPA